MRWQAPNPVGPKFMSKKEESFFLSPPLFLSSPIKRHIGWENSVNREGQMDARYNCKIAGGLYSPQVAARQE